MSESTADVQREIAASREQVSETVAEIEAHVSSKVEGVKRRLDVAQLVREHPWPALAVALGAGVALAATDADRRAVHATKRGARTASRAGVSAANAVLRKVRGGDEDRSSNAEDSDGGYAGGNRSGFAQRLGSRAAGLLAAPLTTALDRLLDEMRSASRDVGSRLARRSHAAIDGVPADSLSLELTEVTVQPMAVVEAVAPEVPVPPEMLPTELDARADAVEALGLDTKEPPLAPGAGDLGARWA